jgi:hypothetical protein
MRKFIAIPLFALLILIGRPYDSSAQTVYSCGINQIPLAAANAGYTVNTFISNSFSTANVDMGKTYASGFQWYAYNFFYTTPTVANVTLNSDGSMTVGLGGASYSAPTMMTAGSKSASPYYTGTAFGGGAYIEASLKFNAQSLPTNAEWPAFWASGLEAYTGSQWSGQATGYEHFIEVDIMEYFEGEFSQPLTGFASNLHDWYGPNGSLSNYDVSFNGSETQAFFSAYHKYGVLWIPATSTASGSLTFYIDGTQIGKQTYTQFTTQSPPPSTSTPWAFGVIDGQHLVLQFDSNNTYPITVQSVNVWQSTNAYDMSN